MKRSWKVFLIGCIIIASVTGCGTAAQETSTYETSTSEPTSTAIPSTSTPLPPTRTPFPSTCTSSDSTIREVISAFERLANEKNVEVTMELFAENAILEESFQGVYLDETEEIESLWQGYYRISLPCEFRDILVCENNATFLWAELGAASTTLWPIVIEVKDGKITYMDFYEDSTKESIGEE